MSEQKKVGIVMGSDSDFPVVRKAAEALKEFGIPFEMRVLSAHRSPKEVAEFAQNARENGFGVIIAAAGMAAHLAAEILAVSDAELADKLLEFKKKQNEKNLAADKKMQETAKEI